MIARRVVPLDFGVRGSEGLFYINFSFTDRLIFQSPGATPLFLKQVVRDSFRITIIGLGTCPENERGKYIERDYLRADIC